MLLFGKKSENKLIKKIKYNKEYDWKEGKAHLDLFDTDIDVLIHNDVDEQYAESCIEHINNLSPSLKNYLTERLYKYYDFIRRECDDVEDISFDDILKHVYPLNISIEKPEEPLIAYSIECGCDWEEEHGAEIIIKDNEILFVGEFVGLGPWADKECYETVF